MEYASDAATNRMVSRDIREIQEDSRVQEVVNRLKGIETLSPDGWRNAGPSEKMDALRRASEVLGEVFEYDSPPVAFSDLGNQPWARTAEKGEWTPQHLRDGTPLPPQAAPPIELNQDYLGFEHIPRVLEYRDCENPGDAVGALCHEYRHVYERYRSADENGAGPESAEELARWDTELREPLDGRSDYEAYRRTLIEHDARFFADEVCRRMYGS